MAATREARAIWRGDLKGSGEVSAVSSGRFDALPISWAARTEAPDGKTSPEELLAAAHASCFAMALSAGLGKKGTPADRLAVTAKVTFDKLADIWTVFSSELEVTGIVPGSDAETFAQEAERAGNDCPISRALRGVKVIVRAELGDRSETRT
jgi:osmotically inducible protein OsmC